MITEITDEAYVRLLPDFDNHVAVYKLHDDLSGLRGYIAVHRRNRLIPSFGATRLWAYKKEEDGLADALRLSKMMSYKSALAGLNCGGAKGVIIVSSMKKLKKHEILRAYAKCVDALNGQFITGTDVGLEQKDLAIMKEETPYIIGFNDNSTFFTALGLFQSIRTSLKKRFNSDDVFSRSFAIQGFGKIGREIVHFLVSSGCQSITVSEIDEEKLELLRMAYPTITIAPPEKIHTLPVDVFVPCALGGVLTQESIKELQCSIVAGGANNQLADASLGQLLLDRGVLYAPDYIINAGGLISVFDEYTHPVYDEDRVMESVEKIQETLEKVFSESDRTKTATNVVAGEEAERIFNGF